MMNGHGPPTSYAERLNAFRKSDSDRDDMVNEVIRQYEELKLKYDEKCDDYHNEVESRRLWQSKAREHEGALREQRQASVCEPYCRHTAAILTIHEELQSVCTCCPGW